MSSSIVSPFPFFTDTTGAPLEGGYIFIGQSNLNPETAPVNVFWDSALTIPAAQPVRTVGGYPSRAGTPSRFYSATDTYSITVRNKNRVLVFSAFDQSDAPTSVFDISTQLITATASQTTFSLTTFTYLPGTDTLQVFRNGLRLNLNLDYLESNSSTVTLTAPAALGDQFLFQGGTVVTGNQVPGSQVSFLQAGTGAVTRNMQDKARESVSVKDFGAVGDGVADDTAAIQATINVAQGSKSRVHIPAGVYKISSELLVSNLEVQGDGVWCTYILQSNNVKGGFFVDCNYASGGKISDLSIHAVSTNPGQTKSTGIGLKVNRANGNWICQNVDINGFATGIQSSANYYAFFKSFQVLNASTAGIHLAQKPAGAGYFDSAGVFFDTAKVSNFGTLSSNTSSTGILVDSCAGDHFTSIDCTSFNVGVSLAPVAGSYISHLFFDRVLTDTCVNHGWVVDSSLGAVTNLNMVDCWSAFNTNGIGLWIKGSVNQIDDIKWIGGNIRENGQHGVRIDLGKNIRFVGTAIATNSKLQTLTYNGVYLSGALTNSVSFVGCGIGNFSTSATHKQLSNIYVDSTFVGTAIVNACDLSSPGAGGVPINNQSLSATLTLRSNLPIQSGLDRVGGNVIRGITTSNIAANTTTYLGPNGQAALANAYFVPGQYAAFRRIYFAFSNSPGAGQSFTFTLQKNGVDTSLVATATGAQFDAVAEGLITVSLNDFISIKMETSATANAATVRWSAEITG